MQYTKIIQNLENKKARQYAAIQTTEEELQAIRNLQDLEAAREPKVPPKGR